MFTSTGASSNETMTDGKAASVVAPYFLGSLLSLSSANGQKALSRCFTEAVRSSFR